MVEGRKTPEEAALVAEPAELEPVGEDILAEREKIPYAENLTPEQLAKAKKALGDQLPLFLLVRFGTEQERQPAKQELVLLYNKFVRNWVYKDKRRRVFFGHHEDMISEAYVVVLEALDSFEPEQGYKFTSYLDKQLRKTYEILNKNYKPVSVRVAYLIDYRRVMKELQERHEAGKTDVTVEDVYKDLNMSDATWKRCVAAMTAAREHSYDELSTIPSNVPKHPKKQEPGVEYTALSRRSEVDIIIERISSEADFKNLRQAIRDILTPREFEMLALQIPVLSDDASAENDFNADKPPVSTDDIGERYGVSGQRVRQILSRAKEKLHKQKRFKRIVEELFRYYKITY